jgi:2,3-bisphosphoglycerate-independent phosphoglycerate mutase
VGPVWAALEAAGKPYRLLVCTDHRTPVAKRGHTADPVPFAWLDGPVGAVAVGSAAAAFDESVPVSGAIKPPLACHIVDSLLRH